MSTRPRLMAASVLLLVTVSGALAAPRGFVLCVAEGDHVAIETAVEFVPCGAPLRVDAGSLSSSPIETCTDTPTLQVSLRAGDEVVAPPMATSTLAPYAVVHPIPPDIGGPWRPAISLRAIRTIVLVV